MLMLEMVYNYILMRVHNEEGQGMVEYALILFLVSIVAIIMLALIGTNVTSVFNQIANKLS